jgi:hypothetical protein
MASTGPVDDISSLSTITHCNTFGIPMGGVTRSVKLLLGWPVICIGAGRGRRKIFCRGEQPKPSAGVNQVVDIPTELKASRPQSRDVSRLAFRSLRRTPQTSCCALTRSVDEHRAGNWRLKEVWYVSQINIGSPNDTWRFFQPGRTARRPIKGKADGRHISEFFQTTQYLEKEVR